MNATSAAVAGGHSVVIGQLAQTYSYASGGSGGQRHAQRQRDHRRARQITISDGTAVGRQRRHDSGEQHALEPGLVHQQRRLRRAGQPRHGLVRDRGSPGERYQRRIGRGRDRLQQPDRCDDEQEHRASPRRRRARMRSFSVDGISMTSSSNTVTTAIPGVTMQLLTTSRTARCRWRSRTTTAAWNRRSAVLSAPTTRSSAT